jgi:hypothetical protein
MAFIRAVTAVSAACTSGRLARHSHNAKPPQALRTLRLFPNVAGGTRNVNTDQARPRSLSANGVPTDLITNTARFADAHNHCRYTV